MQDNSPVPDKVKTHSVSYFLLPFSRFSSVALWNLFEVQHTVGGFGGLAVSLWYPRSRVRTRPKPSDSSGGKIHSMPSFGGGVKPSVPCRRLEAC
jgi:hypothetical protein